MDKANWIAIAAIVLSMVTYGVNDLRMSARYQQKVDDLCNWKDSELKVIGKDQVQDARLDILETNVDKLVGKIDILLDELMEVKYERKSN